MRNCLVVPKAVSCDVLAKGLEWAIKLPGNQQNSLTFDYQNDRIKLVLPVEKVVWIRDRTGV
jgi:hypothetical protein